MSVKKRLTITVDPELVLAGQQAVEAGEAESLSGWVNAALEDRTRRDTKLRLMDAAIADYEAEFGEITDEQIAAQRRRDRKRAIVIRGQGHQTDAEATSA